MTGKLAMLGASALALGLGPAAAQTAAELDTNGDGNISVDEVVSYGTDLPAGENAFGGVYDFDIAGGITAAEYAQLEAGRLDANADGMIDEEEYASWVEATGGGGASVEDAAERDAQAAGEAASGGLSDYDTNSDSQLDAEEFAGRFQSSFDSLDSDGDGELSQEEFLRAEFARFDSNGDGMLSEDEVSRWNEIMSGGA